MLTGTNRALTGANENRQLGNPAEDASNDQEPPKPGAVLMGPPSTTKPTEGHQLHLVDSADEEEDGYSGRQRYEAICAVPALSADQKQALLSVLRLEQPRYYPIILTTAQVCLPVTVVVPLRWCDWDREHDRLTPRYAWTESGILSISKERAYRQLGGKYPQALDLPPDVTQALVRQRAAAEAAGDPVGPEDWIFLNPATGLPWQANTVYLRLRDVLVAIGAPPLGLKELHYALVRLRIEELSAH